MVGLPPLASRLFEPRHRLGGKRVRPDLPILGRYALPGDLFVKPDEINGFAILAQQHRGIRPVDEPPGQELDHHQIVRLDDT